MSSVMKENAMAKTFIQGDSDAVFLLRSGATLKNVIIGANQAEGVHCDGPCTLEFVWFEDVCEDAITIVCGNNPCLDENSRLIVQQKNDEAGEETWIIGGGAYYAADKIVQHNGCGTVNVRKKTRPPDKSLGISADRILRSSTSTPMTTERSIVRVAT